MIKLRLAEPCDFMALSDLRQTVFQHELRIQQETYCDVFHDDYSKNFVLERDGQIVGAVRLAFSRELQEYFVSYLVLLPALRNVSLLRLLVGAVILAMRRNGIQRVSLHASDENLQIYLGMGCRVDGPRFQKSGFACFWTPMIYQLGTNDAGENAVVNRVSAYFPDPAALDWKFTVRIELHSDWASYQDSVCLRYDARIGASVPHIGTSSISLQNRWMEPCSVPPLEPCRIRSAIGEGSSTNSFEHINCLFARRHPILARRGTKAHAIATIYSLLSGRYLQTIDRWDGNDCAAVLGATSAFAVLDSDESGAFATTHAMLGRQLPVGIAVAANPSRLSELLLRNYFDFIGPFAAERRDEDFSPSPYRPTRVEESLATRLCVGSRADFADIAANIEPLFASGRVRSHFIFGCADLPRNAIAMLDCLLASGFAIGAAICQVNLAYQAVLATPLMLVGDPALRLRPCQSRIVETVAMPRDADGSAQIMASGAPTGLLHLAGSARQQK